MATKVSADKVLTEAGPIEKVWKANPDMKLGKGDSLVELTNYQASVKSVTDLNDDIDDARNTLTGLLNQRDDAAKVVSDLNTRARSAIRGIHGPDSTEYEQAGGTRSSERKTPVRKKKEVALVS